MYPLTNLFIYLVNVLPHDPFTFFFLFFRLLTQGSVLPITLFFVPFHVFSSYDGKYVFFFSYILLYVHRRVNTFSLCLSYLVFDFSTPLMSSTYPSLTFFNSLTPYTLSEISLWTYTYVKANQDRKSWYNYETYRIF